MLGIALISNIVTVYPSLRTATEPFKTIGEQGYVLYVFVSHALFYAILPYKVDTKGHFHFPSPVLDTNNFTLVMVQYYYWITNLLSL